MCRPYRGLLVLDCMFPTACAVGYGLASLRDLLQLGPILRDRIDRNGFFHFLAMWGGIPEE